MKKIKRTISSNVIILKPQNLNSKHNFIIQNYLYGQNVEKHKKYEIVNLSFPKDVSFYNFSVPRELQISEILFVIILLTKTLIGNRKRVLFIFIKDSKYSCSGPPTFKNGTCRLRFS